MTKPEPPFKIATPCPASWEGMSGDDRKRFCAQCQLQVHNLSAMERPEAEQVLEKSAGRLCVSYHCDEQKRPLFRADLQALAATAASAALLLSACTPPAKRTTGAPMPLPSTSQPATATPPPLQAPPPPQQMLGKVACPPREVKKP